MNEKAERINGWAAMIGVIAAMGQLKNQDLLMEKTFLFA